MEQQPVRLSIELPAEEHQLIKVFASIKGLSIKDYVRSKLFDDNTERTKLEQILKKKKTFNADTIKAFKEVDAGKESEYDTIDDLYNDNETVILNQTGY